MRGVETLAVALVVFADEPDSLAGLLFLRRDLGSSVVIVRAGEVDEWGGDPSGRPGGIR